MKSKVILSAAGAVKAVAVKLIVATKPLAVFTPGVGSPRVSFTVPFTLS